jgi:hypothetical protein
MVIIKVIWKMKDAAAAKPISEFCGPRMRGKVYSYTKRSGGDKKAKGMKKAVIRNHYT